MSRWFRFYDEALNDPKVQALPSDLFKAWINLLCLASQHGGKLPSAIAVSFALRLPEAKSLIMVAQLAGRELLDPVEDGYFEPHNWPVRQYKSDVSTDRVKQFRERKRNVPDSENETLHETLHETDVKHPEPVSGNGPPLYLVSSLKDSLVGKEERSEIVALGAKSRKRPKCSFPADWSPVLKPDEIEEFQRFKTSALAHDRQYSNWGQAWENWKISPYRKKDAANGSRPFFNGQPARGSREDLRQRTVAALDRLREYGDAGPDDEGGRDEAGSAAPGGLPKLIGP